MGIVDRTVIFALWTLFPLEVTCFDAHSETIIRSFLPITISGAARPFQPNVEMMFFNVSAVGKDEEVQRAELHLHRRRIYKGSNYGISKNPRMLPSPSRVLLYQVRQRRKTHPRRLASIPVTTNFPGGWTVLDMTAILNEIHGRSVLLGVRFEAPKNTRLTLLNFLKIPKNGTKTTPAYLVLFTKLQHEDEELGVAESPKERHIKHKETKDKSNDMPNEIPTGSFVNKQEEHVVKQKSKKEELALSRRNRVRLEPFLHTGEIDDLRRSLRKF